MNNLVNKIIVDAAYIIITVVAGVISYNVRKFLESKKELIEKQKEDLKAKIGEDQYNKDKQKAIEIIQAVEQIGKEYNWKGDIKHSKAVEMITQKTSLQSEDIYNIIKSTVLELKK